MARVEVERDGQRRQRTGEAIAIAARLQTSRGSSLVASQPIPLCTSVKMTVVLEASDGVGTHLLVMPDDEDCDGGIGPLASESRECLRVEFV